MVIPGSLQNYFQDLLSIRSYCVTIADKHAHYNRNYRMEEHPSQNQRFNSSLRSSSLGNKKALYCTSNQEYGSAWVHEDVRPEALNIKTATVPTYAEVIEAATDFKKTERLIKSKILREQYEPTQQFNQTKSSLGSAGKSTIRQFPVQASSYKYPSHGMKVGSLLYKTSNMSYGDSTPSDFEIPLKYQPCDSTFSKGFNGGMNRFNGLNTAKTISQVHNTLNEF